MWRFWLPGDAVGNGDRGHAGVGHGAGVSQAYANVADGVAAGEEAGRNEYAEDPHDYLGATNFKFSGLLRGATGPGGAVMIDCMNALG